MIRAYCGSNRLKKQTDGYRRRGETRRKARGYTRTDTSCRLIKVIRRLTNGEESRGALWTGRLMHVLHARACRRYKRKRYKKGEQKIHTLSSKLNLSMRGLSMRADRRCAPSAHSACFTFSLSFFLSFFCRLSSLPRNVTIIRMRASFIYIDI